MRYHTNDIKMGNFFCLCLRLHTHTQNNNSISNNVKNPYTHHVSNAININSIMCWFINCMRRSHKKVHNLSRKNVEKIIFIDMFIVHNNIASKHLQGCSRASQQRQNSVFQSSYCSPGAYILLCMLVITLYTEAHTRTLNSPT